jgi:carbonic anhydrase
VFQYEEILPEAEQAKDELFGDEKKGKPLQLKYVDGLLKIKYDSFGKLVTLDGAVYFAEEIVIHTPAEHKINGKAYDMELQIIHYGKSKGDIAKQVIVSFLFEKQPGATNQFLDSLDFYNLPSPSNKVRNLKEGLHIPKLFYSETDKEFPMMKTFSFYTYQGSISFPPCTQRTINYIASQPIKIGTTAFQLFQEAIRMPDLIDKNGNIIQSPVLPENNRKIQPLNGRAVFFFDHIKYCGPNPSNKKTKKKGHYEKVIKKKVDYFFVNGANPSGLPGAFVVTPKEALGK